MKTIKEIKQQLTVNGKNTLLGMHINSLMNKDLKETDCAVHHLEIASEIFAQMYKNGIDAFEDSYKMGSVTKAFYQVKLNDYKEYK